MDTPSPAGYGVNPKRAVPILLFSFVFCLVIDNGFKFMSKPIADALDLSVTTVSLQATLAGIVIGIGAVVYAALADAFSIRSLMITGIALIVTGSLIGFFFQNLWPMVLAGRVIQTTGLAAAETLYVIYVTKYLDAKDRKTYLGFSTSAFQAGLLFGILGSGFLATTVSWTAMFLVPLILVFTIPLLIRRVPPAKAVSSHLDVLGLFLIAVIATSVMLFMQDFNWIYLAPVVLGTACFIWHISAHEGALVRPEFFTNRRYVWALVLVLVVYSVQLAYIFMFPFATADLHGMEIDEASMLLAPGYAVAIVVGALSGKIGERLTSRQTIAVALGGIILALALPAVFTTAGVAVLVISIILFASAFALLYAPLVSTAISTIPAEKSGVAIGFYNLTINIAIPVGIAYTAKLMDLKLEFFRFATTASSDTGVQYATVLWTITLVAVVGSVIYLLADRRMTAEERRAAAPVAADNRPSPLPD
ncbi:MFS transporter [Corynebacterium sp. TAE3-ERU16]|uniref:MFS transporter n=1 Tax=Corynebacterium sp. TAE3-ERU16 TaxID=2849493 RepID=UPI001C4772C3|nr:MFS transporter [Corynebacterium sp. TAE3-ERU16]MBV7292479.1 MFS transporter [Corynebacterium sp. TAE3-ERU16]